VSADGAGFWVEPGVAPAPAPAVWLWDGARGRVVWANETALSLWGARDVGALAPAAQAALRAAMAAGGGETVLAGCEGSVAGRLTLSAAALPDGRIGRRAAFAPEPRAEPPDALAAAAFHAAPVPLAVLDASGATLLANAAFRALDRAGREALAGAPVETPAGRVARVVAADAPAPAALAPAEGAVSALALARIAHEFRSPLTAVLGFAEFLREAAETTPPERLRGYLDDLSAAAERMRRLADDIVALGAGGAGMRLAEAPLDPLVEDALRLAAPAAGARGVSLAGPGPTGLSALIDPDALGRALGNLIDNAVRHGRAGGAVTVTLADEGRETGATLAVADDGPGMDAERLARALAGRVEDRRDGRKGGLGLSIVREIAEAHGGRLEIETAPDAGLTARLRLPGGRVFRSRPPRR
jgi:signal transduction histidine kinase